MPGHGETGEREFEVGKDEAWFANIKRTYDEYQDVSLTCARDSHAYIQKVLSDAQQNDNERNKIANIALEQAVRHSDIAINKQWNMDPSEAAGEATVLRSVTIDDASLKAIGAVVAVAMAEALSKK